MRAARLEWLSVPTPHAAFAERARLGRGARLSLRELGFEIVASEEIASPAVHTIALPPHVDSVEFGEQLDASGVLLAYRSDYLIKENSVQVCLMGDHDATTLQTLIARLRDLVPLVEATPDSVVAAATTRDFARRDGSR